MKQVSIIGGGLAGLSLGIALRQVQVPVKLFEAQKYPRHRLCGEFLHGAGEEILEQLGLNSANLPADAPRHQQVLWADARAQIASHALPQPVRGLSRYFLDDWLAERFQQLGGQLQIERQNTKQRTSAAGQTDPDSPQQSNLGEGWVLCTGRERQLGSPWFGIKQQFAQLPLEAGLEMHLGKHGYLGLTQVEGGWVNACGIFRRSNKASKTPADQRLQATLKENGLAQLAQRLEAASTRPQSLCGVASLKLGRQKAHIPAENATAAQHQLPLPLRLGDQRLCTSPLSGNGQSMALESGFFAAPILQQWSQNLLSWAEAEQQIEHTLQQTQGRRLILALTLHRGVLWRPSRKLIASLGRRKLLPLTRLAKLISQ